jgi:tRNA(Ile)-lysidine synthase
MHFLCFDIGVQTEILELQWPDSASPSKVSAFETHARRLRFQALGRACRDSRIETLLMGHHRDDNVETTLWRLCSGARGAGLSGIPHVARIPECHGIYGVSEGGSHFMLKPPRQQERLASIYINPKSGQARVRLPSRCKRQPVSSDVNVSTGGILICRPLLRFPKRSLVDTCNSNNVPFVSDPTNFNPTLTPRNAIRSLMSSNRLPRALQTPSILRLIERSKDLLAEAISLSNRLLGECKVLDFNARSGWMIVQIPTRCGQTCEASTDKTKLQTRDVQALTLRRLTELLSPFEEGHFPLKSFESSVKRIFLPKAAPNLQERQPFTVGGVMFRPFQRDQLLSEKTAMMTAMETTWLLSRQPYMRHRLPKIRFNAPIPWEGSDAAYTDWVLWDNRYWFRTTILCVPEEALGPGHRYPDNGNKTRAPVSESLPRILPLVIRPLERSDLKSIGRALDHLVPSPTAEQETNQEWTNQEWLARGRGICHASHDFVKQPLCLFGEGIDKTVLSSAQFRERLACEAPDAIRFTLPLLAVEQGPGLDELPLALPTVGVRIAATEKALCYGSRLWRVKWEWMYKRFDPEPLRLMGWLDD